MISSLLKEFQDDSTFAPFLNEDFDSQSHASSLLQGAIIAEQLGKLNIGISKLENEIQNQVGSHYEDLLSQTTGVETLEDVLNTMHARIQTLKAGVERLRARIIEPYNQLDQQILLLSRLHATCELLRRIIRCLSFSQKLQEQLANGPRDIIKAASSLKELDETGKDVDLSGITILEKNQLFLRKARADVEKQATMMMDKGIELQNQSQVGTALQVFFNLGMLNSSVDKTVNGFIKSVKKGVTTTLDINYLTDDSQQNKKGSGPGKAIMPTIGQSAQFRANLWAGLEKLMETINSVCMKTYQLHKVLAKKRDSATHVCFLDEIYKSNGEDLFTRMWKAVTDILTKEFTKSAKESTHIRQSLEVDYPRLVRLYGDLWKKVEDISLDMRSGQTGVSIELDNEVFHSEEDVAASFDPEVAFRRSLIPLEKAFISRSLSRLFDAVNLMFSTPATVPTKGDIDALIKTVTSELNISAIDKSLSEAIVKSVVKTIQLFCQKCEHLIVSEEEACQVIGAPTNAQRMNVNVVNQLIYVHRQIDRMASATLSHLPQPVVQALLKILPSIDALILIAIEPLFVSLKFSVEAILLTMHNEDFSRSDTKSEEQCSLYMKELQKFMSRASVDYVEPFAHSNILKDKIDGLCRFILEFFVRHLSLLRPVGEQGKMRLAADFAQVESVMEYFIPRLSELGSSYRLIRAFRPLLFQTPSHIASSSVLGDVIPHSTVLHFLFCKAPSEMRSPHQTAGWTAAKYSQWMDEHPNETERLILVKGALEAYVSAVKSKQLTEFDPLYPVMREILQKGLSFVDPLGQSSSLENGK